MEINLSKKLLDILIENSLKILSAGFGLNWVESAFFEIVRLLRQEEKLKDYFLDRSRATLLMKDPSRLDVGMVPIELIELVTYEFRWPEMRKIAEDRIDKKFSGDKKLAIGDIVSRVFEAYDDNWRDKEFYEHYKL